MRWIRAAVAAVLFIGAFLPGMPIVLRAALLVGAYLIGEIAYEGFRH
jgi:uncharacterized protein (DUF2344 family)